MTGRADAQGRRGRAPRAPRASSGDPRALHVLICSVGLVTAVWSAIALLQLDGDGGAWGVTALLTFLAIAFEEGSRRVAKLQIRLRTQIRADMTSVWIVTAGVAVSPGRAVLFLTALYLYLWFRQSRPAGELLHRKVYNACTNILVALVIGVVVRAVESGITDLPAALTGAIPVLVAIVVALLVARALITIALITVGARGKMLLGTQHDNLIELATSCLGGLVALAVQHEPWLTLLVIAPMVTLQRGALVRDLEAAAITDAKTGLLNAVAWEQLAQREMARAERADGALAIMIIDIDRFKAVNDRYGHLVGDKVLAGVAHAIRDSLREYDGAGRFGGEEFVAVMPDAGEHDALVIAERVRLRVNELTVAGIVEGASHAPSDALVSQLSVSVGVAVLGDGSTELSDLLHAADQALYRAKWNGRNQVQLARRGDEIPDIIKV